MYGGLEYFEGLSTLWGILRLCNLILVHVYIAFCIDLSDPQDRKMVCGVQLIGLYGFQCHIMLYVHLCSGQISLFSVTHISSYTYIAIPTDSHSFLDDTL